MDEVTLSHLTTLAIALGLGLFVGLQRERGADRYAGGRTFALITVLGAATALVGPWVTVAGFLGVITMNVVGVVVELKKGRMDPGVTTAIAALVMYTVGVLLVHEAREIGVAIGAGTAVLLQVKERLVSFVERLGDEDVRAILMFTLMSFIILPIVPNQTYGPYDVLNPYQVWLMVVLVVGITLGGYIAHKFLGTGAGSLLAGVLGGAISSTATTVSISRSAAGKPGAVSPAVVVIMLATGVMYVRVLVELYIVAREHWWTLSAPIGVMLLAAGAISAAFWFAAGHGEGESIEYKNPTELKSALFFGAMYAGVLLLVAWTQDMMGQAGLYVVAGVSGLTDMDAITLTTARLVSEDRVEVPAAWRAIVIGSMSNLVFKGGIVVMMGARRLFWPITGAFGALMVVGSLLLWLWPG